MISGTSGNRDEAADVTTAGDSDALIRLMITSADGMQAMIWRDTKKPGI